MSTTDAEYHDCAVCSTKTMARCGRCKETFFCSRECQALVWPTHKWLCGKSSFSLPPLLTSELLHLRQIAYLPYQSGPLPVRPIKESLLKHLESADLFRGTCEELYNLLTFHGTSLLPWQRFCVLAHAQVHLDNYAESRHIPKCPWRILSRVVKNLPLERYTCLDLTRSSQAERESIEMVMDKNAFVERISPFLKQHLIYTTLKARQTATPPPAKLTPDLVRVALTRSKNALSALRLDNWTDSSIRSYMFWDAINMPVSSESKRLTGSG